VDLIVADEKSKNPRNEHDIIGLCFYETTEQYKLKFQTLLAHLGFDHHPIRKLMDIFRAWIENFIKEKHLDIKQAAGMFSTDNPAEYISNQTQKLLRANIECIKEFVKITSKAMVLFYQLDVKKGEITEVCLYNLLTSLVLKNPVYTKIIDLFKSSKDKEIEAIENKILKVNYEWDLE
jgi:hypothetical protein